MSALHPDSYQEPIFYKKLRRLLFPKGENKGGEANARFMYRIPAMEFIRTCTCKASMLTMQFMMLV